MLPIATFLGGLTFLILHELVKAGGRVLIAQLLQFLKRDGEFGASGGLILPVGLSADLLGFAAARGRWWRGRRRLGILTECGLSGLRRWWRVVLAIRTGSLRFRFGRRRFAFRFLLAFLSGLSVALLSGPLLLILLVLRFFVLILRRRFGASEQSFKIPA